jgi:hypothetical protein
MASKTFDNKPIRAEYNAERREWLFSAVDACGILSKSKNSRRYWSDLKRQLVNEASELYEKIVQAVLD